MNIKQIIRQLLEHAAGTKNEAEAETYIQKAQEMMLRHNISEASLPMAKTNSIIHIKDFVSPPYEKAQVSLLGVIAKHNHCECIYIMRKRGGSKAPLQYYLIGTQENIDYVKDLFASLLFQAMRKLLKLATGKSEKHNYLLGFASGVNNLLESVNTKVTQNLPEQQAAKYELMTITDKQKREIYERELFKTPTKKTKNKVTHDAFFDGVQDGNNASLARGTLV